MSKTIALLWLLLILIPSAFAKDASLPQELLEMDLERLMEIKVPEIYSASKFVQPATEAPGLVTVVTAEEIAALGYRNLTEVLNGVGGIFITNDRNYQYTGFRGFIRSGDYDTRLLLLLNGKRLNDNIYGAMFNGEAFPIDIDLIDRVEISRGPVSSLYGTNAVLGVINVITKKGADLKGTEVSVGAETFDTYAGRVSSGGATEEGIDYLLSASLYDSHGNPRLYYPEYAETPSNGWAENVDDEAAKRFYTKVTHRKITFESAYDSREKCIPTGSFGTLFNSPRTRTWDKDLHMGISYDDEVAEGYEVNTGLTYDEYRYRGDYLFDYSEAADASYLVLNQDNIYGNRLGSFLELTHRIGDRHTVSAGGEMNWNFGQNQRNEDRDPYNLYLDDKRDSAEGAVYLQGDVAVTERFSVNSGLRLDLHDDFGPKINPRLGFVYDPWKETFLKALYAQAYRAPNVYERFFSDGGVVQASNPDLEPEEITSYELILEQLIGRNTFVSIAGFRNEISDLISQTKEESTGLLVFENLEKVIGRGLEVSLRNEWSGGWKTYASYLYNDTENRTARSTLIGSPRHVGKAHLIAPLWDRRAMLGSEGIYVSGRSTPNGGRVDDYFVFNMSLWTAFWENRLVLSTGIFNVFDEKYSDPAGLEHEQSAIEQDGRIYRAKVTYRF